jgi:hypothetical protein
MRILTDKTDIGRIKNGFDFLGYQFGQEKSQFQKEQYKITFVD